jgi:2-haloacid dehalogenase
MVCYRRQVPDGEIAAVVFDLGGVLLDWDPRHLYRRLIGDQASLDDFLSRICTPQWHRAHDLGADTEQSCRELARLHPEHADLIMAWADHGDEMVAGQIDAGVAVLADVKATGTRCFALSNMERDKYQLRRSAYSFFGMFDGCVISGVEGAAKPESKIFEILLSRYRLEPRATVFIDDMARNVVAARELGIVALEYSTADQLRRDLLGLGVLPAGRRAAC